MINLREKILGFKKLGSVQRMWLENLEKYPERQGKNILGHYDGDNETLDDGYKACCLGELLLCGYRKGIIKTSKLFDHNGLLIDGDNIAFLQNSWRVLGLRNRYGRLKHPITIGDRTYSSLTGMNEGGITWPDIASYVRKNPRNVFRKGV